MKKFLVIVGCLLAFISVFAQSPWPKFHANAQNTGLSPYSGSNGIVKWVYPNQGSITNTVAIASDGTIYAGSTWGYLYAINPDGSTKWVCGIYGTEAAPAINPVDGTIYVSSENGNFCSVNPTDGSINWTLTFPDSNGSSPALATDGTIYLSTGDGNLTAINPDSSIKWASIGNAGTGTPAIGADGTIYVGNGAGYLLAINPVDGSINWAFETFGPATIINSSPSVASDGTIYIGTYDLENSVYAVNPDGSYKWSASAGSSIDSSPAIGADGTIYMGVEANQDYTEAGGLLALNPVDGSEKWKFSVPGGLYNNPPYFNNAGVYSSPAIGGDGTIYVAMDDNNLWAINPDGTAQWSVATNSSSGFVEWYVTASPAIGADGTVYIGSPFQGLYAVGGLSGSIPVAGLTITPNTVAGGVSSSGTVTIASPAPSGGNIVNLVSNESCAQIPPSVTVPENASTATFTITTTPVSSTTQATITALSGGANATAVLTVTPPPLVSVTVSPNTVVGGSSSTGTVTLGSPAPAGFIGGINVLLSSQYPGSVVVPGYCLVPTNSTTATFTITTNVSTYSYGCVISASLGATTVTTDLLVLGESITNLTLNPSTIGDNQTSTGTLTIATPAPPGGWLINLSTEYPASVSVPTTVTVPAGSTTVNFTITSKQFSNTFVCGIYSFDGHTGKNANLTVVGDSIASLTLNPTTIGGDQTSTGTVTLTSAAPTGGWVVNLSTEYPASVGVSATLTIPAGATSGTFTITTQQFPNNFACGIYSTDGHSGKNAILTIMGDSIASLTLNPSTIGGDQTSTGTITLTSPAPVGGWVVNLSDQFPASVGIPSTVTFPVGTSIATFTITTRQFSNTFTCGVYATDGHSVKNATLTVVGDSIASLTLNPASVVGGTSSTGTVTLMSGAPPGGWLVQLSCEYPSVLGIPPTLVFTTGQSVGTFTITTATTGATYTAGIYSTDGTSGKNATLTITNH